MDYNLSPEFIDFIVSRFFCNELEAVKVKCYYFDGSVQKNVIVRDMLEEICLNCDYHSDSEEEESEGETEENESGEEDPK